MATSGQVRPDQSEAHPSVSLSGYLLLTNSGLSGVCTGVCRGNISGFSLHCIVCRADCAVCSREGEVYVYQCTAVLVHFLVCYVYYAASSVLCGWVVCVKFSE